MPRVKRVATVLGALESSRRRLVAEVEGLLEPRFSARPKRGGWSAAQVFEHLTRVETGIARAIEAGLAGKPEVERRASDPFRRLFYLSRAYHLIHLRTTPKLDPLNEAAPVPPRGEALPRLEAVREQLVAAIEAGEGRGLWKLQLRHPIFGPLSTEEMLDFVANHQERHRLQIVRIKAALEREGR